MYEVRFHGRGGQGAVTAAAMLAAALLEEGRPHVANGSLTFDLSGVTEADSSALAVLLELRRECARAGKRFVVQGLPSRLSDLAKLYGISGLLPSA